MPQNKYFKLLVRERMAKTGESYSVARMRLLQQTNEPQTKTPSAIAKVGAALSLADGGPGVIYQIRLSLNGISPTIWRRLQVPADVRLHDLSLLLLGAMGWTNSHLHMFTANGTHFGQPDPDWDDLDMPEIVDDRTVRLRRLVDAGARTFEFLYDFGDHWEHTVEIESADIAPVAGVLYPSCTGGERACPPEDCGGTSGYEGLLEILADPAHEEHNDMRRWVGGHYDAGEFNLARTNAVLRRLSRRRRTPVRRAGELPM